MVLKNNAIKSLLGYLFSNEYIPPEEYSRMWLEELQQLAILNSNIWESIIFSKKNVVMEKIYKFLSPKGWIWKGLMIVTLLRLCVPVMDFSSCMDIFILDFYLQCLKKKYQPPLEMKFSLVSLIVYTIFIRDSNSSKNQRYTFLFNHKYIRDL